MKKKLLLLLLPGFLILMGCKNDAVQQANLLSRYADKVKTESRYRTLLSKDSNDTLFAMLSAISHATFDELTNSQKDGAVIRASDISCHVIHIEDMTQEVPLSLWHYTLGCLTWTYKSHPFEDVVYVAIDVPPNREVQKSLIETQESLSTLAKLTQQKQFIITSN